MAQTPTFGTGKATVVLEPDWEERVNKETLATFRLIAKEMEAEAKSLVPVDTGDLRRSIKSRVQVVGMKGRPVASLEASAPYALFVEYGTGRRGARSPKGTFGLPGGYRHGGRMGMVAQPFLRPALASVLRRWFGGVGF